MSFCLQAANFVLAINSVVYLSIGFFLQFNADVSHPEEEIKWYWNLGNFHLLLFIEQLLLLLNDNQFSW